MLYTQLCLLALTAAVHSCRVLRAAQDAISSSLLEVSIDSATGVLFNVTGPLDLGLAEVRPGH
jgi:cell division GTPase FtsZ